MRFFRLVTALGLALAVSSGAAHATGDKPADGKTTEQTSSQADTPAEADKAPDAKAEDTSPSDATSDTAADQDKAADPAPTASTAPDARSDAQASSGKPLSLTIASWGGAYAKSQELAFIEPFRTETGAEVRLVSHGGEFAKLKDSTWDVVDLGQEALQKACNDGLLERIGTDDIAAAGAEAPSKDDFLPGGLQDCGVATVAWSAAIAFDKEAFENGQPKTAADFFDVEKFPGSRAIPNNPKYLLPLALMADGVAPGDVYKTLENGDGVKRALARLEAIRGDIVWWRKSDQALKLLANDSATMALAFSGRIFYAMVRDNQPLGVIWDGQIYDLDLWAVPKDAPNRDAALKFIAFSIKPERLAAQTRWFPYGPMRKSALARVGRHAVADVEMSDYVPTSTANFERALRMDPVWWAEHGDTIKAAFESWMVSSASAPASDDKAAEDKEDAGEGDNKPE
jgi:putative spermidine/putrescine transport system substrate-binding protein